MINIRVKGFPNCWFSWFRSDQLIMQWVLMILDFFANQMKIRNVGVKSVAW